MKTLLRLLLPFFYSAEVLSGNIYFDVANFCNKNGLVYPSLTTTENNPTLENAAKDAFRAFESQGLRSRRLLENNDAENALDFNLDVYVVITETSILSRDTSFQMYLEKMSLFKIKRSLLVFSDLMDAEDEENLMEKMQNLLAQNAFFYMMYQKEENVTTYKQIISLTNHTVTLVQDIEFNALGQASENYNLEGTQIISYTLSWAPYFSINNCDDNGQNCELEGFLSDFMDAVCQIVNCTWTSYAPVSGSWGVRPISGPYNKSGVWGGAMGRVLNGEYHISLSQWVWNIDRYGLLDFVSTTTNRVVLALTPQPPEVDTGLFIRPFKDEAWGGIGILFLIIIVIVMVPYATISYYEHTDGYNLTAFVGWMFFVLINAYYGGALTMFFTSEQTIPFNSIEDVMRAYPDWKLKMMTGNDVHFQYKALEGDQLYAEFWDRVLNLPEETVYSNLKEGLEVLQRERAVIHTMTGMLKGYFQANPFHQQNLKVFAYGRPEYYALIMPFNSPLKPILQKASNTLIEAGTSDYLLKLWEGKGIPQSGAVEIMILSAGQVILVFFVMGGTFSFALFIFCCEMGHKKIKEVDKRRQHRKQVSQTLKGNVRQIILPKDLLKYPDKSKWGEFYDGKEGPASSEQINWY